MKNKFLMGILVMAFAFILAFGVVPVTNVFAKTNYVTIEGIGNSISGVSLYGSVHIVEILVLISCVASFYTVFRWLSDERKRFAGEEE